MSGPDDGLAAGVRRGLGWGSISAITLRMGSLVLGIVLARLLSPAEFGVYAVALTVQSVLMTLADLGMSVDLVRAKDPERRAPTVATLSLLAGIVLALTMSLTSVPVATMFGSASAAPIIIVLSLTLVMGGAGVVPFAKLQREFKQKQLFATSAADFIVGTAVTVGLVVVGLGPMSLAVGRIAAQGVATTLQFVLAKVRPRFGFDREIARPALRFGLPLAAANLLSWALLNIDNVVIARVAGETALGFYVLAFNISSWPMTVIGQTVRGVSLAAFSRLAERRETASAARGGPQETAERDKDLAFGVAVTWAAAVPAGALLVALAYSVVDLLYGHRWAPSAAVLAALGVFGASRVLFDLIATYLMARGASGPVLWVQILWICALTPAMIVGTHLFGIVGGGWAHVVVGVAVIFPAYLLVLHRRGTDIGALLGALWPPILAAVPAAFVAYFVASKFDAAFLQLIVAGPVGLALYVGILVPWLLRLRSRWVRSRVDPDLAQTTASTPDPAVIMTGATVEGSATGALSNANATETPRIGSPL
ncbi:PST family polysaccharide transporter [Antricoccus suffuscus]|uniref:PST family polysaccharide transporter n=1 Tax=Antricoccus suffuscus TaxID=1629062 RepID=A0A2T1A1X8_9ACTN|nr:lipopolysaccharide biosynthesis protein [Antricoccus suffuscus]PRZ42497.1 PST family polysaccharide transporter [Antricoccus suffuscus]